MNSYAVARAAGVGRSVVSLVVNGRADQRKIPQATQDRVRAAIRQTGYTPNRFIRDMFLKRREILGVGADGKTPPPEHVSALVDPVLSGAGYRVQVATLEADPAAALQQVTALLNSGMVVLISPAIATAPASSEPSRTAPAASPSPAVPAPELAPSPTVPPEAPSPGGRSAATPSLSLAPLPVAAAEATPEAVPAMESVSALESEPTAATAADAAPAAPEPLPTMAAEPAAAVATPEPLPEPAAIPSPAPAVAAEPMPIPAPAPEPVAAAELAPIPVSVGAAEPAPVSELADSPSAPGVALGEDGGVTPESDEGGSSSSEPTPIPEPALPPEPDTAAAAEPVAAPEAAPQSVSEPTLAPVSELADSPTVPGVALGEDVARPASGEPGRTVADSSSSDPPA